MRWKVGKKDPRELLGELMGGGELPSVAYGPEGKPCFPDAPRLHFSWSRSGELALCALGEEPLGADVEQVRPRSAGLPRYALNDREYAWFQSRGEGWEDFYTLWTLKEARVKCTGEGIFRVPARQVPVPLLAPGERGEWEGFTFSALGGEGWRGAVCEKKSEPNGKNPLF